MLYQQPYSEMDRITMSGVIYKVVIYCVYQIFAYTQS